MTNPVMESDMKRNFDDYSEEVEEEIVKILEETKSSIRLEDILGDKSLDEIDIEEEET